MTGTRTTYRIVCVVLIVLAVGMFISHAAYVIRHDATFFDDSYMFLRYAKNLLNGDGVSWNPSDGPTYGITSILHLLVVTFLRFCLPCSDTVVLKLSSLLPGLLAGLLIVHTCARFAGGSLRGNYLAWGAMLLPFLFGSSVYLFHSRTGMDTMCAVLLNALLVHFTLAAMARPGRRQLAGLLASAIGAFLARPDNGIYVVVFPAAAFIFMGAPENRKRLVASFAIGIIALLLIDTLWKYLLFGDPIPLSFHVKKTGYYVGYLGAHKWSAWAYLLEFLRLSWPFLLIMVVLVARKTTLLTAAFLAPVVLSCLYFGSVLQIMGQFGRFYMPALPFVVVCSGLIFDGAVTGSGDLIVLRARSFCVRAGLLGALVMGSFFVGYLGPPAERARQHAPATQQGFAGRFFPPLAYEFNLKAFAAFARRLREGSVVAASEHGYVAATAMNVEIVDILGLHDRYFARNGFSTDRLLAREPDVLWFAHTDYAGINQGILASDRFRREYVYYPGAFNYGVALRRDGPFFTGCLKAFAAECARIYPGLDIRKFRAAFPGQ